MHGGTNNLPFANEQEDPENSPENSAGSARSPKMVSLSSPKKSKRTAQRKVVSVPIGETEGPRLKGETTPPSDSWAWRKYGQKPIKGSPYPRGYYRCSSSKGCPARKQVERSKSDPNMLVVTYAFDHNHPSPAARNNGHNHHRTANQPISAADEEKAAALESQLDIEEPEAFTDLGEESLISSYGFKWFSDLESTSSAMLESTILGGGGGGGDDGGFPMGEEEESLFADLGELPECSAVFRRGAMEREEEHQRCNLAPSCG